LGNIPFADPSRVNCTRSPDGNRIAFSEWGKTSVSSVRWFDLRQIDIIHDPLPALPSADFAFSPDSTQLAMIACEASSDCGVYLLDLDTERTRRILSLDSGYGLTWSPDGENIALLGTLKGASDGGVIVVEVRSNEVIYRGAFDWMTNTPAPDSPTHRWGVQFPSQHSGLEACTTPTTSSK
jgi:Tol biopolymer transport system component